MPSKNGRQTRRRAGSASPPLAPQLATRTIAVTSGKGGVGKTSVVVNLAVALAREGVRVSLLDADYGLGNVDIFLGLETERTLEHLLGGSHRLEDVLLDGPEGVRILPASTGVQQLTRLSRVQSSRLQSAVADLTAASDVLLVDTATGISDNVVSWLQAANEVLVVTSPDPAAIVDAYAVLKLLAGLDSRRRLLLLVNNVRDEQEASAVHQRLESAVCEFLHTNLVAFGHVLRDPLLQEAVRRRQPIVTFLPDSPSSACFTRLARRLLAEAPGTTRIAPRTEPAELVTATK